MSVGHNGINAICDGQAVWEPPAEEPDNPAAWALARHIADHPVSTLQAAFRYLNAPPPQPCHSRPPHHPRPRGDTMMDESAPHSQKQPDAQALPGGTLFIDSSQIQSVQLAPPPIVSITATNGRPLVTIHPDGRIELGDDYEPDEAAQAFWQAVERFTPSAMVREFGAPLTSRVNAELVAGQEAQRKLERLDSMAAAWLERLPDTIRTATAVEAIHHVTRETGA